MTTSNDKAHRLYWQIGKQAVEDGVLTEAELKTICRWGHRKCGYWNRHLLDLQDIIRDRNTGGLQDELRNHQEV